MRSINYFLQISNHYRIFYDDNQLVKLLQKQYTKIDPDQTVKMIKAKSHELVQPKLQNVQRLRHKHLPKPDHQLIYIIREFFPQKQQ